jgi:hypothetical protein
MNSKDEIIPPPTLTEVQDQIKILKKNKAPGDNNTTAEIIVYTGEEMVETIYQLSKQIWEEKCQWNGQYTKKVTKWIVRITEE